MHSKKTPYGQSLDGFDPTHYYGDNPLRTFSSYHEPWLALARQNEELRIKSKAQAALIRELEPRAAYCDAVLRCHDAIPITLIAQDYGVTAQRMNRYLYARGVQYPCGSTWALYQRYAGRGYVQPDTALHSTGHCKQHTRWTQKGRAFIYELLKSDGVLPLSERMDVPADIEDFWLR